MTNCDNQIGVSCLCGTYECNGEKCNPTAFKLLANRLSNKDVEAWLFHCWKPGTHMVYVSIEKDDNSWWPADKWKGVTRVSLVAFGNPELIHGILPPSSNIITGDSDA